MSSSRGQPRKNPYLSQFKSNIGAQQKLIRQRLGYPPDENDQIQASSSITRDRESFPCIDDENTADHHRELYDKHHNSGRSDHFDYDPEESLQFFKRNLLPKTKTTDFEPSTGIIGSAANKPSISTNLDQSNLATHVPRSRAPLKSLDLSRELNSSPSAYNYKTPVAAYRANAPKETTTSNNNKSTAYERQPSGARLFESKQQPDDLGQPDDVDIGEFHTRYQRSFSRTSIDKLNGINAAPPERPARSHRPPSGRQKSPSSLSRQTSASEPKAHDQRIESTHRNHLANNISTSPPAIESPMPSETFSRKPLYNSLLRAHDSIRLKVNRPKVRPRSQQLVVNDTEVDDSIQLAEIDPSPTAAAAAAPIANERAVDVKPRKGSSKRGKSKKSSNVQGATTTTTTTSSQMNDEGQLPVRNFSEVRVVKVVRSETERSLGVTVRAEEGNIVVARILAGSLADKQGALQVGDVILAVNNREVYTPEQLQEQLRRGIHEDTVVMKIVPSFREELPTLCLYLRALFNYDANEDSLLPCREVGVSFNQGDILEVVNQEDPNWWQARRVESENLQTGLIPSQELEERRRAFVIPDYDLATRTSICGTKVSRKSKKKEIYSVGQNCDFDKAELQLYEEVCRTPAFERRTLVLIGANGVGKQALKARLITMDPERFGTPLPHTSRLPREGEEDGVHYHFVTRERMEEDIIAGKYLEYGEYDEALYGTKLDSVREIIGSGKVCVLDCSPTCLKILKTSDYLPFVAFIAAPTLDQLRYMQDWNRGNKTYATFDRALSRQSRRARTLQDFAYDFFEDEDLQVTVEESARLFRMYENYFDIVLVNNHFEQTFQQLRDAIDALSMAPQWIPISWIYGT